MIRDKIRVRIPLLTAPLLLAGVINAQVTHGKGSPPDPVGETPPRATEQVTGSDLDWIQEAAGKALDVLLCAPGGLVVGSESDYTELVLLELGGGGIKFYKDQSQGKNTRGLITYKDEDCTRHEGGNDTDVRRYTSAPGNAIGIAAGGWAAGGGRWSPNPAGNYSRDVDLMLTAASLWAELGHQDLEVDYLRQPPAPYDPAAVNASELEVYARMEMFLTWVLYECPWGLSSADLAILSDWLAQTEKDAEEFR